MKGRIDLYAILRRPYSVYLSVDQLEQKETPRETAKEREEEREIARGCSVVFVRGNQMASALDRHSECFNTRIGVG